MTGQAERMSDVGCDGLRRSRTDDVPLRSRCVACSTRIHFTPLSHENHVMSEESLTAVFVDFENLALGVRDMKSGEFQISLILKRLLEKGRIVYKRAYCDWKNYRDAVREFHSHGIELIDIPQSRMSGKNSADIRMVVDALDLCYSKSHIDCFALISGDSDFSPLVSKLKENNKRVIGCGVRSSTSDLLVANCDQFIFYDDLVQAQKKRQLPRKPRKPPVAAAPAPATTSQPAKAGSPLPAKPVVEKKEKDHALNDKKEEARERLVEVLVSLEEDYEQVWGSMLKQVLKRVYPGFTEKSYGYDSFSELLNDAADEEMIDLEFDEERRNYRIWSLEDED